MKTEKPQDGVWFEDATEINKNPELPSVSHIKGGLEPDTLDGYVEGDIQSATVLINPRRIGDDWKNIPIESTYRLKNHEDSIKQRFLDLIDDLSDKPFTQWFNQDGDLTESEKNFNHALNYFINRLFDKQPSNDLRDIIKYFEYPEVLWEYFEQIYIIDDGYIPNDSENGYDHLTANSYQEVAIRFVQYLNYVENVKIYQAEMAGEELLVLDPEHRWSKRNAKRMLAKFYDLEQSRFSDQYQTMITFTSYQDNEMPDGVNKDRLSWFNAMENIKSGLRKILEFLRHQGDLNYVWVFEPHKTGYPHVHLLIFGEVAEWLDNPENKKKIRELWTEKYNIAKKTKYDGDSGIGVDYTVKRPGEESDEDAPINSISNYLMKYFNKNFGEVLSSYETDSKSFEQMNWGEIIYNACMYFTGYRTWGASQDVASVMKTEESESEAEYKNLGGELEASEDVSFESVVKAKGDKQLEKRLEKRKELKKAIKERHGVET